MIDQYALAVLASQLDQAVARDSPERLEHQDVELATVLLLREVEPWRARSERGDVRKPIGPFREVGEHEQRDVHEVQVDQRPVEVVESRAARMRASGAGRFASMN